LNYTRLRALILFSFRWVQQPRHFLRRAQLRAGGVATTTQSIMDCASTATMVDPL